MKKLKMKRLSMNWEVETCSARTYRLENSPSYLIICTIFIVKVRKFVHNLFTM